MFGIGSHLWNWRGDLVATSDAAGVLTPAALTDSKFITYLEVDDA